jgi:hypothetical protein
MFGLVALLCLLAVSAHVLVVEIPLPGLLGTYPPGERTVSFKVSAVPSLIHGASLRISGTTEFGILDCDGVQYPYHTDAAGYMWDTPSSLWSASNYMPVAGYFSWTVPFSSWSGATWNFLMDGAGDMLFTAGGQGTWCSVLLSPVVTVTEAVLIVDAEFPIAVEQSTWGHIKSLYR